MAVLWTTLLFLTAAQANAACGEQWSSSAPVSMSYDPFEVAAETSTLILTFDNREKEACELRITLTSPTGGTPPFPAGIGDVELAVRPISGGAEIRELEPGVYLVPLAADTVEERLLELVPTADGMATAGHTDIYIYLKVEDAMNGEIVTADTPLLVTFDVLSRAQINIAGAAASFGSGGGVSVVDFGELEQGEQERIFIQFRSTSAASISMRSQNDGALVGRRDVANRIMYQARVNGQSVDLSRLSSFTVDPTDDISGVSLPLDIIIGNTSGAIADDYDDVLEFEIAPL